MPAKVSIACVRASRFAEGASTGSFSDCCAARKAPSASDLLAAAAAYMAISAYRKARRWLPACDVALPSRIAKACAKPPDIAARSASAGAIACEV